MPDIITHYRVGEAALALLPQETRRHIHRKLFAYATSGPDTWFSYRFYRTKAQEGKPARGNQMQQTYTGEFLMALAERARADAAARDELFSYLSGFFCHYCLDRAAHPYIIYRSGEYDGTEGPRANRGSHILLEHALDWRTLRAWGARMGLRPISLRILRLHRLPSVLREPLNAVYEQVYGWRDTYADLARALQDQRFFYFLIQDPTGLLNAIVGRLDNGVSKIAYFAMSYHGKQMAGLDVANEARLPWRSPYDADIVSTLSFDELTDQAAHDAAGMIAAAWAYLSDGNAAALSEVIGSASYATGFDWRDPRNERTPACEPLPLHQYLHTKG